MACSQTPGPAASELPASELPASALRSALELAWAVARLGLERRPPIAPPKALRPLLQFARLPDRALATVRRALDDDEDFRARVTDHAVEADLGRLPWVWLTRPEGWEAEVAEAERVADEAAVAAAETKAERGARRRLEGAETARRRAEEETEVAQKAAAAAVRELALERQARLDALDQATRARATIDRLEERAKLAEADSDRAAHRLSEMRAAQAKVADERRRLTERVAELERALDAARSSAPRVEDPTEQAARVVDQTVEEVAPLGIDGDKVAELDDRFTVAARAVADAAVAAAGLSESLAAAAEALGAAPTAIAPVGHGHVRSRTGRVDLPGVDQAGSDAGAGCVGSNGSPDDTDGRAVIAGGGTGPARVGRSRTSRRMVRRPRRPARLPPAVFDDSAEAAEFLIRLPGSQLLVDGYNVSMVGWPDFDIAEQRRRLTAALAELVARVGLDVHVIFDGAEQALPPGAVRPRQAVRVSFSPPQVDADEVIIELVGQLPPDRPLVVATNDRRVRDEVRRLGANVVSSDQLLGALGRGARGR